MKGNTAVCLDFVKNDVALVAVVVWQSMPYGDGPATCLVAMAGAPVQCTE